MKRVAVIGSPGAGKTTFSRELAKCTGLPLVHLDSEYHLLNKDYENNRDAWIASVAELIRQPSWIIDGNYKSTFELRFGKADTIIFLDYPTHISIWRAFRRRFEYRNKVRPDMPDTWKEKIEPSFLWFMATYRRTQTGDVHKMLDKLSGKNIVVFNHPRDAQRYLNSMPTS